MKAPKKSPPRSTKKSPKQAPTAKSLSLAVRTGVTAGERTVKLDESTNKLGG